ncbi:glycerophosphodiester phosphodiesterase [Streptomyces monashensis]|uniref:Glycerophosphodiester phosphodiesterase n=1 Tax=Streptomyces monashensis TaxID=1678012 RepID=A0A1S2QAN9_9ACTN|nr:glycerophosphodiester phosphodiesterase family protein [Streptomyces monashensis]OIK03190.1 glycerophosphodiester phosphodiesterase [Streptomyces monashensis]
MHARVVATTTAATVLGIATVLLITTPDARAGGSGEPTVIGHRGAAAYAPENTLPSIDKAAKLGVTWVENDVQRTKDGELVVIHDDSLKRTTDVERVFPGRAPWKVKDFTAAEIARLDAGSWYSPAYAGTRVPTLAQYMRRIEHNHEKLLLEIKNPELYPGIERQTLKLLGKEGWLDGSHLKRLIVQSFSADSIRTVHELKPAVTTALLGSPKVRQLYQDACFADLINPSYGSLSRGYVAAVHTFKGPHGKKLGVLAWTVDDAADARTAAEYGVDGIITNKIDVVRAALGSH